jgi:hypothetical protein
LGSYIFSTGSPCARDSPPAGPAYPRGELRRRLGSEVATFNCRTTYPSSSPSTVKSFEQRELHGTVTIRPELGIPRQEVTRK